MDKYSTRMFFENRNVSVIEGQTLPLDFIVNSGYVAGYFTTDGC
jgi:hypothetical protein